MTELRARFERLQTVFPIKLAARLALAGYDVIGWAPVLDGEAAR